jgi:hypothetical protein
VSELNVFFITLNYSTVNKWCNQALNMSPSASYNCKNYYRVGDDIAQNYVVCTFACIKFVWNRQDQAEIL